MLTSSKKIVLPSKVKRLYIVTSNYHVDRAKFIFNHFYAPSIETTVISADNHLEGHEKYIEEQKSLASFVNTFKNVDFSNDEEVFQALVGKHPYYNGEIFPKFYQSKGCFP